MSIQYINEDFVLEIQDNSNETLSIVNKYEAFLEAITTDNFEHVREAIRKSIAFFVSNKYPSTKSLAEETYNEKNKLKLKYDTVEEYLAKFKILNKKSASIDLATGTGKSWVIYGVAQIMLAEGIVDKVLVLCPSLTIEEELKKKFENLSGNSTITTILQELGALYPSPSIKSANDPILNGDICVENIHAAYERTGSSIQDSFKGKGQRILVISDEAHHIYSPFESSTKKWFDFIVNPEYDFQYLLGLSGTPYIENEYFHDVIYRYGLKQAMEDGIIKKIDYKIEEADSDKGFDETYHNHAENQKKYAGKLKPITILITDKIVNCVLVWKELVDFISKKERISFDEASNKVIWVTSGISSGNDKSVIESIVDKADKVRKENILSLKTVDEIDNPVEWIVSVSMLTEGWDVKNVFQIVPHEQRAFNSKLLISQVLGRGLRIPFGLEHPVYVKINNHEKWTQEIKDLYNEILEIENRINWGYHKARENFAFPLYNLEYSSSQTTTEIKRKTAKEPVISKLDPQNTEKQTTSVYSETGSSSFTMEIKGNVPIDVAVRQMKLFLKEKDADLEKQWPNKRLKDFIQKNLSDKGYDNTYVSQNNLNTFKQAFGPMFRDTGKEAPRMKMKADTVLEIDIKKMPLQSFSEHSIKDNGNIFYTKDICETLIPEQKNIISEYINDKANYSQVKENIVKYGGKPESVEFLVTNLHEIDTNKFITPQNIIYTSYKPECSFTKLIFENIDLFDSILKSSDKGFYYFPYSYKPTETGSTHVKREHFNPDFFIKVKGKNEVLVVEIKADGDSSQKNKAKYRDGLVHFNELNSKLASKKIKWTYHFYFLSEENYTDFFQAIRSNKYSGWKSVLMQELETK